MQYLTIRHIKCAVFFVFFKVIQLQFISRCGFHWQVECLSIWRSCLAWEEAFDEC